MKEIEMNIQTEEELKILNKAQELNKILLREIKRVCEKYNIKYYLICGSILGAIRHKNFVPWDDDVDIAVTRHDFNILKKHSKEEWDGTEFEFVDYCDMHNGAFLDFLVRLVYMKEEIPVNVFRKIRGKGRKDLENHMPLDIYILDSASDNPKKHDRQVKVLQGIYGLCMGHRSFINYDEYKDQPVSRQKIIRFLNMAGKCIPLKLLVLMHNKTAQMYNQCDTKNYIITNGFIFCLNLLFEKKWFAEGSKVTIDGEEFMGPVDWDSYLRKQYGEYMNLPPLEYRHPSHTYGATGIFHTIDYSKGTEKMEMQE